MSKSLVVIAISALVLTGCAAERARQAAAEAAKARIALINQIADNVNQMSPRQIAVMPDGEMCSTQADLAGVSGLTPVFSNELRRRDLVCDGSIPVGRGNQARAQLQAQRRG